MTVEEGAMYSPPGYKTGNWPAWNAALKRRGSLTIR